SRLYKRFTRPSQQLTVAEARQQKGFGKLEQEVSQLSEALSDRYQGQTVEVFEPNLDGWLTQAKLVEGKLVEVKATGYGISSRTELQLSWHPSGWEGRRTYLFEGCAGEDLAATELNVRLEGDQVKQQEFDFWESGLTLYRDQRWVVDGRRQALESMARQPVDEGWVARARRLEDEPAVIKTWKTAVKAHGDRLPGLPQLLAAEPDATMERIGSLKTPGWPRFERLLEVFGREPQGLLLAARGLDWIDRQRDRGVDESTAFKRLLESHLPATESSVAVGLDVEEDYLQVGSFGLTRH
ncbi:MAG: hypothetical protein KC910_17525, partial [Candidatus Eremiobacteraeota bacterium]|nr:hypothetical protein [Candidatus Eremiobacteraeota bacterium]